MSNESNKQCHYWLCRKWARRYANSAANQRNEKKGMSFEDHTVNHPDLSLASTETQTTELQASKQYLDNNLSQNTTTVAYPSGRYTQTTTQIAESLGYKMGLTTNNGLASLNDGLLTLNRIRVNPTTTAQDLLNEIATN
ncbi:polysaccharide deacetylase family protein [Streptococcus constellatus]|uniref:polysaccharide deacetylase family protein n=1 Tax=Streptococcus constellatus TaxID=76860 RepID=UPI001F571598|nr:polysaccharide deacetylase family protein [Streptococcus constellatus]